MTIWQVASPNTHTLIYIFRCMCMSLLNDIVYHCRSVREYVLTFANNKCLYYRVIFSIYTWLKAFWWDHLPIRIKTKVHSENWVATHHRPHLPSIHPSIHLSICSHSTNSPNYIIIDTNTLTFSFCLSDTHTHTHKQCSFPLVNVYIRLIVNR